MSTTHTTSQGSRSSAPGTGRTPTRPLDAHALIAEFFGTLALVFFAVGTAIFAKPFVGTVGIALAFGFVLLAIVYAIGPVSGSHVNPAVTLGMVLARRISPLTGVCYWVAQLAGGLAGAALLAWLARSVPAFKTFGRGAFGTDGYGADSAVHITMGGAFLAETILTALLVFVVLCTTHQKGAKGFDGLPIGASLLVIHLIGIPLTGTSVNPARALGPAVFAANNAMSQVWVFLVAPLAGAVIAYLVHVGTHGLPAAGGTAEVTDENPPLPGAGRDPVDRGAEAPYAAHTGDGGARAEDGPRGDDGPDPR
ncbi:aquaporin [Streptomyces tremellae]|uniref:Porin n=1 Tax=Streptomyces tremellae TaxID=1124239 RepID=A0ABP7DLX1_9ACTN